MIIERHLADEDATSALGAELALMARPGLAILLEGDLGTGKSTLARALIRALAPAAGAFDVPSPTFTLIQTYDFTRIPVAHADLYRVAHAAEIDELGLDELLKNHLVIVEWADKLESPFSDNRIEVQIETDGDGRIAWLEGFGDGAAVIARLEAARRFIARTDWREAERAYLQGDASYRRYERLTRPDGSYAVLADMPARPPEPIIRDRRTYSQIVGRADSIAAVVAINTELRRRGYSAPEIYAADVAQGFALVEDLGDRVYGRMIADGADMREPQQAAVALLAEMAEGEWPLSAPVDAEAQHVLPRYSLEALAIETETLPEWFWPLIGAGRIPAAVAQEFTSIWSQLLPLAQYDRIYWTLRDVHSPNLIWLPERCSIKRVGLIDTQDCVLGHPAYDLASLLQDARATVAPEVAAELFALYCRLRREPFDREQFGAAFAILGAQRATKILGIFARLAARDGRRDYLRHVPRVSAYLEADLQHPILAPLKRWFDRHLPHAMRVSRS